MRGGKIFACLNAAEYTGFACTRERKQYNPRFINRRKGECHARMLVQIITGSDTQLHIAAKSGKKHKKNINDDEKVVKTENGTEDFLEADETDE